MDEIKRFIDVYVPVRSCNLNCHYCYISQDAKSKMGVYAFEYSPEHIGRALSAKRLGGICHFNICGYGETLIPPETAEIIREILAQGHYVFVVTNGLITRRINEMLEFPPEYLSRLGFKFSFHYLELLRTNQLDRFAENVKKVRAAGCSISVEVTPSDELEPFIDELKSFSIGHFGALPHITVPRDGSDPSWPLLSRHSVEEFRDIWGQFDSELLDFKLSTWGVKRGEYCYAGAWSGLLNIGNGELSRCYGSCFSQNIFKDITKPIIDLPIGRKCSMPHCVNSHVFLTLGVIPEISSHTYAQVRNRVCEDGSEWLREPMKSFLSGRLESANELFSDEKKKKLARRASLLTVRHRLFKLYPSLLIKKTQKAQIKRYFEKLGKAPRYFNQSVERHFYILKYRFIKNRIYIKTESIEETLRRIIDDKVSVSRFGDGEFRWIENTRHVSFQDVDTRLSERLLSVLQSRSDCHIVCISPAFSGLGYASRQVSAYWKATLGQYGSRWAGHLDRKRIYYNTNISRFYFNVFSKALVPGRFKLLKKIWDGRDVLIVEGSMSRVGVGNDFLANAKSIIRLIAPKKNAFSKYDEILEKTKRYGGGRLILLALGPTATILAYDLSLASFQAVDIGHADVEYEWYLMDAKEKVPVRWREINEVKKTLNVPFIGPEADKYRSQIADTVVL